MDTLIAMILWALSAWMHPTNSVTMAIPIAPEFGQPVGNVADAYPGRDGVCHIRVHEPTWTAAPAPVREYIALHEVGHCLGNWDPATMHAGDGIMGCGYNPDAACVFTAWDRRRAAELHPSAITPRVTIPMLAR